jgi:hypothetical protein
MSFVNPNTWHLICNNFNLNFIFGLVCLFVCVCAFSLRRESLDMILRDKPFISEVALSQKGCWPHLRVRSLSRGGPGATVGTLRTEYPRVQASSHDNGSRLPAEGSSEATVCPRGSAQHRGRHVPPRLGAALGPPRVTWAPAPTFWRRAAPELPRVTWALRVASK